MTHLSPLFSTLAIAPMVDWTNIFFRIFMRILAPKSLLYTEMQTTQAVHHQPDKSLLFDTCEHPIALQLGGSDPKTLIEAAQMAEQKGFDEINLNLGCPSDRVIAGHFGVCLMKEGPRVAECIAAMKSAVQIPITAKTRIGVDNQDSFEFFHGFINQLTSAGIDKLIVHARKAWLKGLSPKQNRTIPPVHYEYVYRIKAILGDFPVVINGNIETLNDIQTHLETVDGVMLGRLACNNPYAIAQIHQVLYPKTPAPTRSEALRVYFETIQRLQLVEAPVHRILKPILNISHGLPRTKTFKQALLKLDNLHDQRAIAAICEQLLKMEQCFVKSDSFSAEILVN